MAWTSPRTWVAAEVITAALFNTHIRDNLLALSGHGHSGVAGDGATALASLSTVDLADQSGSPAQAGRLQRNGAVLEYYNSAVVYPGEADGITSHGSLRTLGTGAQQAAAGDHTHTPTSQSQGGGQGGAAISDGTETNGGSVSRTPSGSQTLWQLSGSIYVPVGSGNTYTLKLYYNAVEKNSIAGRTAGQWATIFGTQSAPTVASHTVKVTVTRTAGIDTETVETVAEIHESDV